MLGPRTTVDPRSPTRTADAYRAWAARARARRTPRSPARRRGRRSGASRGCTSGSRCRASRAPGASSCSTSLGRLGPRRDRAGRAAPRRRGERPDDGRGQARVRHRRRVPARAARGRRWPRRPSVPLAALDLALFNFGQAETGPGDDGLARRARPDAPGAASRRARRLAFRARRCPRRPTTCATTTWPRCSPATARARGTSSTIAVDDGVADPRRVPARCSARRSSEVGELWERGEVCGRARALRRAGDRRACSARSRRGCASPPRGGRLAVLACTPGEQHALGVQMVGEFLEGAGWEVLQLGARAAGGGPARASSPPSSPTSSGCRRRRRRCCPAAERTLALLARGSTRARWSSSAAAPGTACADERVRAMGADVRLPGPVELVELVAERLPPLPDDDDV